MTCPVFSATWSGNAAACRAHGGACWAFIREKFWFSVFGLYPYEERWRPAAMLLILVAMVVASTWRRFWNRWLLLAWAVAAPLMLVLLAGGVFGLPAVQTRQWGGLTITGVIAVYGLALGYPVWSAAQLGIGLLLWPVVLGLLLVRRAVQGPLPDRLLPTWFITVAPPSVIGLVALVLQAPLPVVAGLWGMALFFLLWAGSIAQQAVNQPFSLTFWAVSFPLAAFTSLTFKLGVLAASAGLQQAGTLLLALTSLVVFGLCLATVRGLREGSLLAPEPVAAIVPVSA